MSHRTNAEILSNFAVASDTVAGKVELATVAESNAGTSSTLAVTPDGLPMRKVGTAWIGGDMTGNARGANALDLQSYRQTATQVASGDSSSAVGYGNTASGYYSSAVGIINYASRYKSIAVGLGNTASGNYSSAVGRYNTASSMYSSAVGIGNTASGNYSSAVGYKSNTTVANTVELGYWSSSSTRSGAVRIHQTGMVALTLQNRSTEYGDGGATHGSEADNTLMREAYSIRRNGDVIILDVNIGGTVKNLTLGTAT